MSVFVPIFIYLFVCFFLSSQAIVYSGNVLALYVTKPPGFKYKSGMYMFVKCPDLSKFEWYSK